MFVLYDDKCIKLLSNAARIARVSLAVKAIAIARGYTAPRGLDLVCIPGFASIESHDGQISAIVFVVTAS